MLETACSALACVFLGKIRHDEQLLQYGVRLYNQAIRHLVYAINHNAYGSYTEDIVYTCVIFQQVQVGNITFSSKVDTSSIIDISLGSLFS